MKSYISPETGERVVIECRYCEKFDDAHTPATRLEGQWEGGDVDVEPHWVPVCNEHAQDWHVEYACPDPDGPIVQAALPEESRLPTFFFNEE